MTADKRIRISVESNAPQVLSELEKKIVLALSAIGEKAIDFAKENCPVDTGRLRNSITYATGDYRGEDQYRDDNGKGFSGGSGNKAPKNVLAIGTNVVYAPWQELKDMNHKVGRAHFLRDAVSTHGDYYKELLEAALKD